MSQRNNKNSSIIYGPVLSRRFGYSLGIDIIPYKICTYDCIYCQLGKTTNKTVERKRYIKVNIKKFLGNLKDVVNSNKRIDYITFSGLGEPTLNSDIGMLIGRVKEITNIPVAVLTGGGLLYKEDVVNDIKNADLIKVSLDAPNDKILKKINRPHHNINFQNNLDGLKQLLGSFNGKVWLEIMLVKGLNDGIDEANEFKNIINDIDIIGNGIEKIHLNTSVRPTGGKNVLIPDSKRLLKIREILGKKTEIIQYSKVELQTKHRDNLENDIVELVKRRPVSAKDISDSLEVNLNEVIKSLRELLIKDKIKNKVYNNSKYYYIE
jgi:wyosine [tRNA(Phe)-imidazoG37] synthetase (radical SAM superfamily)